MWWTKIVGFLSGWGGYAVLALGVASASAWTTYTLTEQIYNPHITTIQRDHAEEVNRVNQKAAEDMKLIAETIGIEEGLLAESLSDSHSLTNLITEELTSAKPEEINNLGPAALRAIERLRVSQRSPKNN